MVMPLRARKKKIKYSRKRDPPIFSRVRDLNQTNPTSRYCKIAPDPKILRARLHHLDNQDQDKSGVGM